MTKLKKLLGCALLAGFVSAMTLSAGVVTPVTVVDFPTPESLTFESMATGNIADNDAIFSTIGILSVSGTASTFVDDFQDREHSSDRALWLTTGNQLVIVDPGNSGGAMYGQAGIGYTIDFTAPVSRFGFSTHDEPFESQGAPPLVITFFSGATEVGSILSSGVLLSGSGPNPDWDRRDFFFQNTDMFDRIVLSTTGSNQGFALDNLTVDQSESVSDVPEPASLTLLGLALMALVTSRKRLH
ncbi:MAG: PEP-CTERM sorting domain-containing protein [Acidobacteria bacterium]|nr:PEP-CTERM sorting domain-containing protein [Acidobacteriota bacterium]MDA1233422.1 PEP-CTERM sorting domain-containing protein [Acidobacteriota bacterium]